MSKIEKPASEPVAVLDPFEIELNLLAKGRHGNPFQILGPHWVEIKGRPALAIRAFLPRASKVDIVWGAKPRPAAKIHPDGVFEAIVPLESLGIPAHEDISPASYRIRWSATSQTNGQTGGQIDNQTIETHDPYAFPAVLTDYDIHLSAEGTHYQQYEKFGAHIREVDGIRGVQFAVWAPNAQRVSVVGNFDSWDGRVHCMRVRGSSGIWEFFMPGLDEGDVYKYEILSRVNDHLELKSDPYGFAAEMRPKTASVVWDIERYEWRDADWMYQRASRDWLHAPMSIYEIHAGAWRRNADEGYRWLTYRELADELIPYLKKMNYTHVELMPIMEHPFDGSWGYQTIGYFAVTSRFGTPNDFMFFVDRCHQEGIGVILDWTPAHFPRDGHGLAFFDGTHLYEHEDPRRGAHPDWGTLVFNYGRTEVQNFLISNALFWIGKYHVDGLRVDAVASMLYLDYSRQPGEWIPNAFGGRENLDAINMMKRLNEVLHTQHPGALMIAEESTSWPMVSRPTYLGGLGYDLKWNMGWMNDTLRYFALDPIHRQYHHGELTFSMLYAFHENFVLPLSHDEVVHGKRALLEKMPGDDWQKFANLRLLFGYMYAHPGKKLLFMGGELAQRYEFWDGGQVQWELAESPWHKGVQNLVGDLNRLHVDERALHEVDFDWAGFEWLETHDSANSVLAFLRRARDPEDFIVVICNFTPVARENYRVGVPRPGFYREIMNTDSQYYAGTDFGNSGGVQAEPIPWSDRPYSLKLRLPPLGAVYFKL